MTEVDRDIGLILLKRLKDRGLITADVYTSACNSRFFDKKFFSHYAECNQKQCQEEENQHDDH